MIEESKTIASAFEEAKLDQDFMGSKILVNSNSRR